MTTRISHVLFACAMLALIAAGVAGPAGTAMKDLGNVGSLLDWVATIALVTGVAMWWLLSLQVGTTGNARSTRRWIVLPASVGFMLVVLHWLPQPTWPQWISALSKAFPLLFAFALWRRWREQGQGAAV